MTATNIPRSTRRLGVTLVVAAVALLITAAPVAADPAVPTNYRSTVTAVVDGEGNPVDLDVEVLGGDTYLVVRVPAGMEVEVPGYDGEPYVRIRSDGTVEVNQRSPARWLNDARYGAADVEVPPAADADAPPAWELAARSGEFAWHDHRIHFMSPRLPAQIDPTRDEVQRVWEWEVPIRVDGTEAVITGELDWVPGPSPIVPIATVIVALAVALALVRLGGPDLTIAAAGALTVILAVGANLPSPPGSDGYSALYVLAGGTLTMAAIARFHPTLPDTRRAILQAIANVPAAAAAIVMLGALTRPIVPGSLPTAVMRGLVAAILALALASLVSLLGQLWAATTLDRDEEATADEPLA